jgi:hypothetical protein
MRRRIIQRKFDTAAQHKKIFDFLKKFCYNYYRKIKRGAYKMIVAIIIGAIIDLIVFCSLCRSAKSEDEIVQKVWDNSTEEYEWDDEFP